MTIRVTLWLVVVATLALVTCVQAAEKALFEQTQFSTPNAPQWERWAPRAEIMPSLTVDAQVSRTAADGSLRSDCARPQEWGGWRRVVEGVKGGAWYRFDAYYRPEKVTGENRTVLPRLDWLDAQGQRVGQPEYIYPTEDAGQGWRHTWLVAPAPKGTVKVRIELFFGWSPGGTIWWDDVRLAPAAAPEPKLVKISTVFHRPQSMASARASVEDFGKWVDKAALDKPDVIVLPEGITIIGTGLSLNQVAEPIPGPTSERLGQMAAKHHCYLVACYYERDGDTIYNTAVLFDRKGQLVGKYHKLYLPRDEMTDGETAGTDTPVFETDFGTVGMMICWDLQYPEPAQGLSSKGARIVFLPIWGGSEILAKARAIEDQIFLVTSGYDIPSMVIDPLGKVLAISDAKSKGGSGIATAVIDVNKRYVDSWQGDLRGVFVKEHREDLP